MNHATLLDTLNACEEAVEWAETQPDLQTAWKACRRGDWMLWLLAKTSVDKNDPRLRLMACDFAEAVLHLVPEGEDRPRKTIETARRFAAGEVSEEELDRGARDARAAWVAAKNALADASAAWGSAWGSARAALVAWAASAAWGSASAALGALGDASAAWGSARAADRAAQSDIIRKYFPECPEVNYPQEAP